MTEVYIKYTKQPGWVRADPILLWKSDRAMVARLDCVTKLEPIWSGLWKLSSECFFYHAELLPTLGNWHYEISLDQEEERDLPQM